MSRDVRRLLHTHLTPAARLFLAPEIPRRKLASARAVHAEHLPEGLEVLALYDDTLFGGASDGFLVCEDRLCWKNLGEEARCLFWSELAPDGVSATEREVLFGGGRVQMYMQQDRIPAVVALLTALAQGGFDLEIRPDALNAEALRTLARRRLGEHDDVFYAPHFPERKLECALETHAQTLGGEAPVVLMDDTVFGSAEEGFLLTPTRVAWKNLGEDPVSRPYAELDPGGIIAVEGGVQVGGTRLDLTNKEELGRGLARLLRDLAELSRGHPVVIGGPRGAASPLSSNLPGPLPHAPSGPRLAPPDHPPEPDDLAEARLAPLDDTPEPDTDDLEAEERLTPPELSSATLDPLADLMRDIEALQRGDAQGGVCGQCGAPRAEDAERCGVCGARP